MIKLKSLLTEASKHGFDLTDFKNGGFQKVLKLLKIKPKAKLTKKHGSYQWDWKGNGILIVTGNDPITCKYATPNRRKDEKNYASTPGLPINAILWKSSIEVIEFMPIASADPFPSTSVVLSLPIVATLASPNHSQLNFSSFIPFSFVNT